MSNHARIPTTSDVYDTIYSQHRNQLSVHSCFTDNSAGEVRTEWGFMDADYPLIAHRTTWDPEGDSQRKHEYWLIVAKAESEAAGL